MYLQSLMTVHVRWPARPAELRAGLDFFGSFCIKAKRTETHKNNRKNLSILSFACAKESFDKLRIKSPKKSTPAMIYSHCRTP